MFRLFIHLCIGEARSYSDSRPHDIAAVQLDKSGQTTQETPRLQRLKRSTRYYNRDICNSRMVFKNTMQTVKTNSAEVTKLSHRQFKVDNYPLRSNVNPFANIPQRRRKSGCASSTHDKGKMREVEISCLWRRWSVKFIFRDSFVTFVQHCI